MLLMQVDIATHRHLTSHARSCSNRLVSICPSAAQQRHAAAVQNRRQLLTKTFTGETVQVEVDGVVDVHQQEADGLDEQIT